MATDYRPEPIITDEVELPAGLDALVEDLASNAHDIWARQRIGEGWTHGPKRNDDLKQHPGLVPYDDLSESEKDYDRIMAVETLKAISALGYRIVPHAND